MSNHDDGLEDKRRTLEGRTIMRVWAYEDRQGNEWTVLLLDDQVEIYLSDVLSWLVVHPRPM